MVITKVLLPCEGVFSMPAAYAPWRRGAENPAEGGSPGQGRPLWAQLQTATDWANSRRLGIGA